MRKGQLIPGVILVVSGICLSITSVFYLPSLFYGIPVLILGAAILLNKKEDKIEKVKSNKGLRK
jgi:hypothetical protein